MEEEKINLVDNSIISNSNKNLINALKFDNSDKEDFDDDEEDDRFFIENIINRNNHLKFKNVNKLQKEKEQNTQISNQLIHRNNEEHKDTA